MCYSDRRWIFCNTLHFTRSRQFYPFNIYIINATYSIISNIIQWKYHWNAIFFEFQYSRSSVHHEMSNFNTTKPKTQYWLIWCEKKTLITIALSINQNKYFSLGNRLRVWWNLISFLLFTTSKMFNEVTYPYIMYLYENRLVYAEFFILSRK